MVNNSRIIMRVDVYGRVCERTDDATGLDASKTFAWAVLEFFRLQQGSNRRPAAGELESAGPCLSDFACWVVP